MNGVSYTRSTNCLPEREDRVIPIMEQNEHIRKYVSSRKWKLVGKYSDRKHDPELDRAFLEMREDGVNRKFECVVIDSIWQCGRDAFQAIALLRKTFYPAGIQFAVVEDNFCSADAEPEAAVLVDPQAARLIAIPAVRSDFQIFVFMFSFLS